METKNLKAEGAKKATDRQTDNQTDELKSSGNIAQCLP